MRICSKCKTNLPIDRFTPKIHASGNLGFHSWCKSCTTKYNSEHQKSDRWRKYKLDNEGFMNLLKSQNFQCLICDVAITTASATVDHDHNCCPTQRTCGKCIRGLLCDWCNRGLGNFKDQVSYLENAVKYLQSWDRKAID